MINVNFANQDSHIPVMLNEVLRFLQPQKNQIIFDFTLITVILVRGFEIYSKLYSWNSLTYKEKSFIAILN